MNHSKHLSTKSWHNKLSFLDPVLQSFQKQVLSPIFLSKAIIIAIVYLLISGIINNYTIYSNINSQDFSVFLKLKISTIMFWNNLTMFGGVNASFLVMIALLVGINIMLISRKLSFMRSQKNVQWTFSAGIFSLASASCPGCGFSLLSVTGLTSAIPGLPLEGLHASLLIFGILTVTTLYNLRSLGQQFCALPSKSN